MKNFKKQSGVTLVALVITIIVLLILAGASLKLLTDENTGILTRTEEAIKKNDYGAARDKAEMVIASAKVDYMEAKYASSSKPENFAKYVADNIKKINNELNEREATSTDTVDKNGTLSVPETGAGAYNSTNKTVTISFTKEGKTESKIITEDKIDDWTK